MANIATELAAIMSAVFGRDVRQSIYDAIDKINKATEKAIDSGTSVNAGDPMGSYYEGSLYINTSTNKLLRCGPSGWVNVGSIQGRGIASITGPVTSGLTDTYQINYTDGTSVPLTVKNGKGIVSITLASTSGLVDTYTILYNDGNNDTFTVRNGQDGDHGNRWFCGTLVSGIAAAPTGFTLPFEVRAGDMYLNISEDAIYNCVVGAPAGVTSSWSYQFTITSVSTGTNDYNMLLNRPSVNGVTIQGAMTATGLGLQDKLTQGNGILIDGSNNITADFGTSSTTVAVGNHTHAISMSQLSDSDAVDISLAPDSKYSLTAGGRTVKFGTIPYDKWHTILNSSNIEVIQELEVTTIDTEVTIQFTQLDNSGVYELWYDTSTDSSLSSDPRRGEEPIIVSQAITGSGTNCTMTLVVKVPVNPTKFRLLQKANL